MLISIIAAIGKNNQIGLKGKLPWNIPEELNIFKKITMGHLLVMGRVTYVGLPKKLAGRKIIVLTKKKLKADENLFYAQSVQETIELATSLKTQELIVCGGEKVYNSFIDLATKLYLSEVFYDEDADSWFPDIKNNNWEQIHCKKHSFGNFKILTKKQ